MNTSTSFSRLNHHLQAKTKIVATVGPACLEETQLMALAQAGVDVFRINMAHGSPHQHLETVQKIRRVSAEMQFSLGILVDLGGPKIRLGVLPGDAIECVEGAEFRFIRGRNPTHASELVTTYERLVDELDVGDRILLADGLVAMLVVAKEPNEAIVRVIQSGIIRSRQGVNLPGVKLSVQALTDYDRECARWAVQQAKIDFLGLSFVRRAEDVLELRKLIEECAPTGHRPHIIAKIEKPEALENLEAIVQAADGAMVARGDLGVEIDVARLAVEQKKIIRTCNRLLKPVITATQMLDSMQNGKQPTRAEATDVANAILDGTDACMLSGETAVGLNPVAAVQMMNRIALATEPLLAELPDPPFPENIPPGLHFVTQVTLFNACRIAEQLEAKFMVVATHSGVSALAVSKQRPHIPVLGVSDSPGALQQMALNWGVIPLAGVPTDGVTKLINAVEEWGRAYQSLATGDRLVVVASDAWTKTGHNMVLVHRLD